MLYDTVRGGYKIFMKNNFTLLPGDKIVYGMTRNDLEHIRDFLSRKKSIISNDNDIFFWTSADAVLKLTSLLPYEDLVKVFALATFIRINGYLYRSDGILLRIRDLREILGVPKKDIASFLERVIHAGVINIKNNVIFFTEQFFKKGKLPKNRRGIRVNINVFNQLYKSSKHKYLGRILALLPYLNYSFNTLCMDNINADFETINHLGIAKLTTILNFSATYSTVLFKQLGTVQYRYKGKVENAINLFKYKEKNCVQINPTFCSCSYNTKILSGEIKNKEGIK